MTNRYLDGNLVPVREECTATELTVTGAIPDYLDGRYLRIGPNPVLDPDPASHHWFVGDGMVHGVRLGDGAAQWYRNRYVRSARVRAALGEPERAAPRPPDFAANTNVVQHAGRTLALVEAGPLPYELTEELATVGQYDFGGTLAHGYTAHPHADPVTGELHALSYAWTLGNRIEYTIVDRAGRVRQSQRIRVSGSPMMHDFALTERHVVIYDLPVTFDKQQATRALPPLLRLPARLALRRVIGKNPLPDPVLARIARGGPEVTAGFPYSWNPDYPARIGLLPRESGLTGGPPADVQWFEIDPCYIFHTLNAYEDGDSVVIDAVRHEKMFATDKLGPNEGATTLARFTLDRSSGKAREERFDDRAQEFPRIDERRTGRRHRYGYAVDFADAANGDAVLKHDLAAGSTQQRRLGAGQEASEFCFVARDRTGAEDDGVLLGYVYDRASDRSGLRILDAQTLEDVAAVQLPARVPAGFHGNWAPTAAATRS